MQSQDRRQVTSQYDYPIKSALTNWYRRYQRYQDLHVGCVTRVPKFSQARGRRRLSHSRIHDRCIAATMRALGYPSLGTLTAWAREAFLETRTLIVGRFWCPTYPKALRQVVVLDLCSGEESAQQLAGRLGVCRPASYAWKNELLAHQAASFMRRRNTSAPVPEPLELERKLEALQRDVRQLQPNAIC